ncbi:phosphotransferase [Silicimonas algicola]|uniref:Phosphotransferase family enzyme n=1 Tax=Silicimonas algicola TaxID=1826607 RepID=A0A316GIK6_9RHOB|nr:phosphotransferase [Silicimonas algicola]PWK54627.1 phosphotransferase family enzyme [Silicimonas algicola]
MSRFLKTHRDEATAAEALRRASILRRAGLPTPHAMAGADARQVSFARIEGETGLPLLASGLAGLLELVALLHECPVAGLPPLDPFRRIRPREALLRNEEIRSVLDETVPSGTATLHGDLHAGQFIRDGGGTVWIVDLDDLTLGPPEADLANFAAHSATSLQGGVELWADRVRAAWRDIGRPCDDDVFRRLLRIALVRRHLKLRETGRPDHEAMVATYLRESSNFSIL